MAVASPRRPKFSRWSHGVQVDSAAERDGLVWAMQDLEHERAGAELEAVQLLPAPANDDGFDRHDPADAFCRSFASPTLYERDANEAYHDAYRGCFA